MCLTQFQSSGGAALPLLLRLLQGWSATCHPPEQLEKLAVDLLEERGSPWRICLFG